MSKRITLTDFELEQLIHGLEKIRDDTPALRYEVVQVVQRFYNKLVDKLKAEPSSQKVSSDSVEPSITREDSHGEK